MKRTRNQLPIIGKLFMLAFLSIILFSCGTSDEELAKLKKEKKEQEEFHLKLVKLEEARKDTLNLYSVKANEFLDKQKFSVGVLYLDTALKYTNVLDKKDIIARRAAVLITLKRYTDAINDYSYLVAEKVNEKENYYLRGICFHKTKNIQRAVEDLKQAMSLGSAEAEKMHDKINPLRKRVAYYVTRCCDGTESSATGRGACSHHGGVCDWNDPVYEEYRKY